MLPMVSYITTICGTFRIASNGNKNIDSNRMKVLNIGIWDMFDYLLDYDQYKPTKTVLQRKQP
jgi:hypothetical protein